MGLYQFENYVPRVDPSSYVHPEAVLIGNVSISGNCYIGPGASIRADWGSITIGPGSNIQDRVVIHVKPEHSVVLGANSHIGHGAILHGPCLGFHVFVGMGAIIMDEAELGDNCCVAAGTLIPGGMKIPANKLIKGIPGRIVSDVSLEMAAELETATKHYQALAERCLKGMRRIDF